MTVIEGEVISSRDVEVRVQNLKSLDSESQMRAVTVMLSDSRTRLLAATAAHDLPGIVEEKARGAMLQEITKQLRLGKDMQLDAAEFVRRAERGLGIAIREGQQCGTVATKGTAAQERWAKVRGDNISVLPRVRDLAPDFFENSHKGSSISDMTDNVSDEAFETAIAEARKEENLSRANVARKAKASVPVDHEPKPAEPEPEQPQPKKRLTKHDSAEMLANINGMLNGIVESIPFIDPTEVDFSNKDNRRVIENIRESMSRVRKLLKEIENGQA